MKKKNKKLIKETLLASISGAVASAGTVLLSDEKFRNNIKKTVTNMEKEGVSKIDILINKVKYYKEKSGKKLAK